MKFTNKFNVKQLVPGKHFQVRAKTSPCWNLFEDSDTDIAYFSDTVSDDCLSRNIPVTLTKNDIHEIVSVRKTDTGGYILSVDVHGKTYFMYAGEIKGLFALEN